MFRFLYRWGTLLTVAVLLAVFGLAQRSFLDPANIVNILRSISIVTVIAIGVSLSLSVGGFDLSVGSVASLADAIVLSMFVWHGMGPVAAITIALLAGALVGGVNAFLIVGLRIPDMLATLGRAVRRPGHCNDLLSRRVHHPEHDDAGRLGSPRGRCRGISALGQVPPDHHHHGGGVPRGAGF